MAVATPFLRNDTFAARRKAVAFKRDDLQIQQREGFNQRRRLQPTRSESQMRFIISKLRLGDMLEQKDLKRRLIQGGFRTSSGAGHVHLRAACHADRARPAGLLLQLLDLSRPGRCRAKLIHRPRWPRFWATCCRTLFLTNAVQKRQKLLTPRFARMRSISW